MIRIERARTHVGAGEGEREALRDHFRRHHWIKLPRLVEASLLGTVQRGLGAARFFEVQHDHVTPPSIDVCMEPDGTSGMLDLVCNDPAFLDVVESLTECPPLSRFGGFVYRLTPGAGHHHNWHDDVVQGRRVAMSINLEAEPYEGGVLQIRERETGRVVEEVTNTGAGDAVLFRIDLPLQHRVQPVTSGVKTAFAGWFSAADPLLSVLRAARA